MNAYVGVDVYIHIFLTSALAGGEWSASCHCGFTPGERAPRTHWIGSCVGPRAGLNGMEKRKFLTLPGLKLRPLGLPAHRQSLYQLCYPGSQNIIYDDDDDNNVHQLFVDFKKAYDSVRREVLYNILRVWGTHETS
jgi:hypothetical protein